MPAITTTASDRGSAAAAPAADAARRRPRPEQSFSRPHPQGRLAGLFGHGQIARAGRDDGHAATRFGFGGAAGVERNTENPSQRVVPPTGKPAQQLRGEIGRHARARTSTPSLRNRSKIRSSDSSVFPWPKTTSGNPQRRCGRDRAARRRTSAIAPWDRRRTKSATDRSPRIALEPDSSGPMLPYRPS